MSVFAAAACGCRTNATSSIDRAIRLSTAAAVLAVAGIAAYVSYWHAYAVVRAHGESGITARLEPATIDGLVYASSMVVLYAARHRVPVPSLARWLLGLGIAATLTANMAQGWSHGPVGAVVAAWPAVSLAGSYELSWSGSSAASWPRCSDAHPAAGRAPESPKHGEHSLQGSRWIRQSLSALNPSSVSATAPSRTFCRRPDVSNRLAVRPGSGNPGVLLCRLGGRRDGGSGGGRGRYRSADRYPARKRDTLFCLSRSGRDHDAEMTPV